MACSKSNESEDKSPSPTVSNKNDSYAFPLTSPVSLKIFAGKSPNVTKNFNEMQVFKKMHEQSNVTIDWKHPATGSDATQQRNLLIASNDLPDAFYGAFTFTTSELIKFGTEGILIPLEELIEKHAPNLKRLFDKRPELKQKLIAPDGHIYSLPMLQEDPHDNMPNAMLINKKWLDNLNLKMPTTVEEFRDVLRAFKNNDPNKNNKKDEIPFTFQGTHHILGFSAFTGVWGKLAVSSPSLLSIEKGKVEFAPNSEEFKQFLTYMNGLYEEGLIDPEVFTQNRDVYYGKFRNPERIVGVGFAWSPFGINNVPDAQGDYVNLPPLKSPNGKPVQWLYQEPTQGLGAFAITKVNKHPEITMKWIDQAYEPMMSLEMNLGPENVAFKKNAAGKYEMITPPQGVTDVALQHSEAPGAHFVGAVLKEYRENFVASPAVQSKIDQVKITAPYAPKEIFPTLIMSDEDVNKLSTFTTTITSQYNSWIAKFIMQGNIDKEWDKYVSIFKQNGLDQAMKIYQKYYDNFKK
jgi:putative aldouronate transport system substrate-binding protein